MVAWRLVPEASRQLSVVSNVPAALNLPWELLSDDQGFRALRARNPVSIVRRLPQNELGSSPATFAPPLRVLLVTARPNARASWIRAPSHGALLILHVLETIEGQGRNEDRGQLSLKMKSVQTLLLRACVPNVAAQIKSRRRVHQPVK
jgi:hypothetical protein